MSAAGETKFGFCSVMPAARRRPRVSSERQSGGSGVAAGVGAAVAAGEGVAVAGGVACARGPGLSPHPATASASAPAARAWERRRMPAAA